MPAVPPISSDRRPGRNRDALRIRAERADCDLDAARTENQWLAEQLAQAASARGRPRTGRRTGSMNAHD
jgi:hypothetical protein